MFPKASNLLTLFGKVCFQKFRKEPKCVCIIFKKNVVQKEEKLVSQQKVIIAKSYLEAAPYVFCNLFMFFFLSAPAVEKPLPTYGSNSKEDQHVIFS